MCDIVWISPQSHSSLSLKPHFLWHALQWPWPVRKRFSMQWPLTSLKIKTGKSDCGEAGINVHDVLPAWRLAGYMTVYLMTFHQQSEGRRTAVESKSNRSCNHRISRMMNTTDGDLTQYDWRQRRRLRSLTNSLRLGSPYCSLPIDLTISCASVKEFVTKLNLLRPFYNSA